MTEVASGIGLLPDCNALQSTPINVTYKIVTTRSGSSVSIRNTSTDACILLHRK